MITYELKNSSLIIDVVNFNLLINGKFKILKIKILKDKIEQLSTNDIANDNFFNDKKLNLNDLTFIYAKNFLVLTEENNSRYVYYNSNISIYFNKGVLHNIDEYALEYGFNAYYIVNNKLAKNKKHFENLRLSYIRKNKILTCLK